MNAVSTTPQLEQPRDGAVYPSDLLAWEVEIRTMRCICFAATKAKAQWIATKSYWEAYGKNGWPRAQAWRAEQHDKSALRFVTPQRAWGEDYVLGYPSR